MIKRIVLVLAVLSLVGCGGFKATGHVDLPSGKVVGGDAQVEVLK